MEGKKISFGFMKTKKAEKVVVEDKKDFIECVEEKSIKVVGGEQIEEKAPLVIPMKPNTLITAERLKQIAEKVEQGIEESDDIVKPKEESLIEPKPENETLDQMAVRELLQDAKKEVKVETKAMAIAVPAQPVLDGQKESTLDDYESVPIQDFGMAMLRGMGWTPNKEQSKYKQPQLRPKGLGLGADKVVKENQKKKSSKDNKEEELAIVKNSFVKIVTGKYSGYYGKVVSLDEDNGRVMVDIPVKKETVSLSEFMLQAVTKSEYDKESKVINASSYEEYKKNERAPQKSKSDAPREGSSNQRSEVKERNTREKEKEDYDRHRRNENSSNGRSKDKSSRHRRDSSSSEDRSRRRKKDKKRYSSSDSLDSISDSDRRKKSKKDRRHSSSDSDESDAPKKHRRRRSRTPDGKRDIDKKRKGKKKKRDRDRSPHYKKHRK